MSALQRTDTTVINAIIFLVFHVVGHRTCHSLSQTYSMMISGDNAWFSACFILSALKWVHLSPLKNLDSVIYVWKWMAYHDILLVCIIFTNGKVKWHWCLHFSDCFHLHPGFKAATWSLWSARLQKKATYSHPGSLQALLISPSHFCRLSISWISLDNLKKDSNRDSSAYIWWCFLRKQPCLFESFLMHHP